MNRRALDTVSDSTAVTAHLAGEFLEGAFRRAGLTDGRSWSVDSGRDNGDPNNAFEAFLEGRADDDVGILIDFLANTSGCFVDLVQREVLTASNRDQQTSGALHRGVVDQRVGYRSFGGSQRAFLARRFPGTHHRLAQIGRAHV